jgi:hypothetical protein
MVKAGWYKPSRLRSVCVRLFRRALIWIMQAAGLPMANGASGGSGLAKSQFNAHSSARVAK